MRRDALAREVESVKRRQRNRVVANGREVKSEGKGKRAKIIPAPARTHPRFATPSFLNELARLIMKPSDVRSSYIYLMYLSV
jgi:hypothetical protein